MWRRAFEIKIWRMGGGEPAAAVTKLKALARVGRFLVCVALVWWC